MTKTQNELKQLKTEYESLATKLKDLTDDELKFVVGGDSEESSGFNKNTSSSGGGAIFNYGEFK